MFKHEIKMEARFFSDDELTLLFKALDNYRTETSKEAELKGAMMNEWG